MWLASPAMAAVLLTFSGCKREQPLVEADPRVSTSQVERDLDGQAVALKPSAVSDPADVMVAVESLADLMQARLELITSVAQFKWNRKLPIAAPEREAELLQKLTDAGVENDVSKSLSEQFFTAQFEAARLLQEQLFEDWTQARQPEFTDVRDLDSEVRPQIQKLSTAMLPHLKTIEPVLGTQAAIDLSQSQLTRRASASPHIAKALNRAFEPLLRP